MAKKHYHSDNYPQILKASGELQSFSRNKLKRSFRKCGLKPQECEGILTKLKSPLQKKKVSTHDLFQRSYKLIQKASPVAAVNYSLKRALFELGPAGFHFEDFIARIAQELGFTTEVGLILRGQTVNHEVDILAHQKGVTELIECKFHNHQGIKSDIKTVLYLKARMDDLRAGAHKYKLHDLWIATNTSFTKDAMDYALFHGIKLLGTNTPSEENLLDLIKRLRLYPVTSLKRLKRHHVERLLDHNILTLQDLQESPKELHRLGLTEREQELILADIQTVLEGHA